MFNDDLTQPKITKDVQKAINDAATYLAQCKRLGYLDNQKSFNYGRVSRWVECCNEQGDYDDQLAKTVIDKAISGDVDAIETLNFLAKGLIKSGKPLPPNLRNYVADYALASLPTKSKKVIRQRDWYIAKAVSQVTKSGFKPTAKANKGEGHPNASACWIVGQALKSEGIIHLETDAIEKAWNDSNKLRDQLTSLKDKVSIGFVGLALLKPERVIWAEEAAARDPTETAESEVAHSSRSRAEPDGSPWFQCITFASPRGGRELQIGLPQVGRRIVIPSEIIADVLSEVHARQGRGSLYPKGLLTERRRTARSSARYYIKNRPIRDGRAAKPIGQQASVGGSSSRRRGCQRRARGASG